MTSSASFASSPSSVNTIFLKRIFSLLSKLNADVENIEVDVVRDGKNVSVSRYDLVVGDIVRLSVGDILEGDGILIDGFDVACGIFSSLSLLRGDEGSRQSHITCPHLSCVYMMRDYMIMSSLLQGGHDHVVPWYS